MCRLTVQCDMCGGALQYLGKLGAQYHARCRNCGLDRCLFENPNEQAGKKLGNALRLSPRALHATIDTLRRIQRRHSEPKMLEAAQSLDCDPDDIAEARAHLNSLVKLQDSLTSVIEFLEQINEGEI